MDIYIRIHELAVLHNQNYIEHKQQTGQILDIKQNQKEKTKKEQ